MKRICKNTKAPECLENYARMHPPGSCGADWASFCKGASQSKHLVQEQLFRDQRGLCAYCEFDLGVPHRKEDRTGNPDFRVEHFHLQSDTATCPQSGFTWSLDWDNLLACCSGGDDREIEDTSRFGGRGRKNHHCDSRKRDKTLDNVILNPTKDIPAFPCLFKEMHENNVFDSFFLEADEENCNKVGPACYEKANRTICELNLNCSLLGRARYAALRRIDEDIRNAETKCGSRDKAYEQVISALFDPTNPRWPPFFTSIRIRYSAVAEKRLKEINYQG